MSLGSRIISRGRAAITTNLASTPREPLFFLYPQWIRKSSTSVGAASSQDGDRTTPSVLPNIPIQPLSRSPASVTDDTTSLKQRFDLPKESSKMSSDSAETAMTTPHSAQAMLDSMADLTDVFPRDPSDNENPSVVERQVRKVLSMTKNLENTEVANRRVRKAYQEYKREELRSWLPDWRVILADLVQHTPQHGKWLDDALEVIVPLESLPRLLHGGDDFIMEIGSRYGCSVNLGPRDEETQQYRSFIISGPVTAISKTTTDVLRIAPNIEMKTTPSFIPSSTEERVVEDTSWAEKSLTINESDEKGSPIRNVIVTPGTKSLKMPPKMIPRPKIWDHISFLDYTRALTQSSIPNHLNRFGFKMAQDPNTAVTEILRDLFKDPECKHAISRTACNEVMQYFVKINRIEDVRILFVHMEMLDLHMVPETFNIMLRGAAKSEDLHNFHFILHLMLRRGFTPNGQTWLAFMSSNPDIRVKLHILTAMREKGLTAHPSILKRVCAELIQPEIEASLDQALSQDEFVFHMDSRYGKNWLSLESANYALHSLGARGLISRCWEFLHFMDSRFIRADNYSINTILHHCKQATNLSGAVELLRNLPANNSFIADDDTYRILFELAWRSRSYNLARVIWRYACLSAATTYRMRTRVLNSMMYSSGERVKTTPRERWKQFAGPVIFGANHTGDHPVRILANTQLDEGAPEPEASKIGTSDIQIAEPEDKDTETSTKLDVCQFIRKPVQKDAPIENPEPEKGLRKFQQQLWKRSIRDLKNTLQNDYEIYKEFKPVKPLSQILVEALKRDTEWRREGHYAEKDMHSLIQDAIPVLVCSKRKKSEGGIGEYVWK